MSIKRTYIFLVIILFGIPSTFATINDNKFILVIDPGHGGKDSGAPGTYSKEKNINLNVALAFGKLVESNCSDVKVIYTRKKDIFVELQRRAEIANKANADLFISIHTNSVRKGRIVYGAETYTLGMARSADNLDVAKRENSAILVEDNYNEKYAKFNPNSSESYIIFEFMQDEYMKQSVSLAKSIQKYYVKIAGRQNRGVHQAGFLVLRETSMPSVLTELGFISTPAEEAFLNSDRGINKLARSIYEGFLDYKQTQDGKKRATPPVKSAELKKKEVVEKTIENSKEPNTISSKKATVSEEEKKTESILTSQRPKQSITEDGIIIISDDNIKKPEENKGNEDKKKTSSENNTNKTNKESVENTEKEVSQTTDKKETSNEEAIVFKIQFMTSEHPLKSSDKRLKRETDVESYKEKGLIKYTCNPSKAYNEAQKKLKEVRKRHRDAFIIAFRGETKISLNEARNIK